MFLVYQGRLTAAFRRVVEPAPWVAEGDLRVCEQGVDIVVGRHRSCCREVRILPLVTVTGIGGFVSTLVIASFGLPSRRGYVLLVTAALSSCATMAFAYSSWLPAAFLFLALMSLFQSHYRTTQGTVVLTVVPDHFRARTFSVLAYERGFLTAGSVLVGMLADATSASMAILTLGALGLAMTAICAAALPRVRGLA